MKNILRYLSFIFIFAACVPEDDSIDDIIDNHMDDTIHYQDEPINDELKLSCFTDQNKKVKYFYSDAQLVKKELIYPNIIDSFLYLNDTIKYTNTYCEEFCELGYSLKTDTSIISILFDNMGRIVELKKVTPPYGNKQKIYLTYKGDTLIERKRVSYFENQEPHEIRDDWFKITDGNVTKYRDNLFYDKNLTFNYEYDTMRNPFMGLDPLLWSYEENEVMLFFSKNNVILENCGNMTSISEYTYNNKSYPVLRTVKYIYNSYPDTLAFDWTYEYDH